jgi:hypothetical protein
MGLFSKEPKSYEIQGNVLKCLVCGHDEFHNRTAQLHSAGATFFNIEWTSPTGQCFICDRCGFIHWFLPK